MIKLKTALASVRIEIIVLSSWFITVVGFVTSYYVVNRFGGISRFNMLYDYLESTFLGFLLFSVLVVGHGVSLCLWIIKKPSCRVIARLVYRATTTLLLLVFLAKWGFLIINENYVLYDQASSVLGTMTEYYGFAFWWFLLTVPVLNVIAYVHPGTNRD